MLQMDEDEKYNRKLESGLYSLQVRNLSSFGPVALNITLAKGLNFPGLHLIISLVEVEFAFCLSWFARFKVNKGEDWINSLIVLL